MKLMDTKAGKTSAKLELIDGIFLKNLPMVQMMEVFQGIANTPEDKQQDAIDELFATMIVDSKGNAFHECIEGRKASENVPMSIIQSVMQSIGDVMNPEVGK